MLAIDNHSTNNHNLQQQSASSACEVRSPQPQQLSLFSVVPEREDPPPYPLQIVSIPDRERVRPIWNCRLVHYESGLKLGGQFSYGEAKQILETTRFWDFTLLKDRMPRCRNQLLCLLERVCSDRQPSDKSREVAA